MKDLRYSGFIFRTLFCIAFVVLSMRTGMSQNGTFKPVTDQAEIDLFKEALIRETATMKYLKADFVQTKKMEFLDEAVRSTGVLYFAEGKRLRWEYVKPYPFVFIINNTKVWMMSQGANTHLDVKSNKMFKELSELMLFGIGGASLFNNQSFDFAFSASDTQREVSLRPKSKEMKALYKMIFLVFDAKSYQIDSICMQEDSGDETVIQLIHKTINTQLPDALFEGKK